MDHVRSEPRYPNRVQQEYKTGEVMEWYLHPGEGAAVHKGADRKAAGRTEAAGHTAGWGHSKRPVAAEAVDSS